MLLSNAVRLAQSKGLHLQAKVSRNLSEEEIAFRNSLWWSLYSYDKHLVFRLGRPSVSDPRPQVKAAVHDGSQAIDDDDISCPVPQSGIPGNHKNMGFYRSTIRHSQISSLISKRLATEKAKTQTPEEMLKHLEDLDQCLRAWHDDIPASFRNGPPFKSMNLEPGVQLSHLIFTRFIYCGSLVAMHSIFCHPWSRPELATSKNPAVVAQRERSIEIVASAARDIIMATQGLSISASSPVW